MKVNLTSLNAIQNFKMLTLMPLGKTRGETSSVYRKFPWASIPREIASSLSPAK